MKPESLAGPGTASLVPGDNRNLRSRAFITGVVALMALAAVAFAGCRRHDAYCDGTSCFCGNQPLCSIGCDQQSCDVQCTATDGCDLSCGDNCHVTCHGNARCAADLGNQGRYECQDVSTCTATLGEGGVGTCNRVGSCQIHCSGSCMVTCTQASTCAVTCAGGAAATVCAGGAGGFGCGVSC